MRGPGRASPADSLPVSNSPVPAVAPVLFWPSKPADPWVARAGVAPTRVSAATTPRAPAAPARTARLALPAPSSAGRPLVWSVLTLSLLTAGLLLPGDGSVAVAPKLRPVKRAAHATA